LRGTKMEDCIFNGTDAVAPKNMAEVSLTLTDCEKRLGTDYHEVTVTRRVFRSGEGQYFINKTPCRLKDIQRLFMDTGLGTNSYSVMEQGKIDLILRARPEDRREVFEEASGITKYKADKREAMRKLEQAENNLLRLADIVKEVKRQIISIQRQAGKAERYKKMFDQLRSFDVYAARERLQTMASEMKTMETQHAAFQEKTAALQREIERLESENYQLQDKRSAIEGEISGLQQAIVQLDSEIEQCRQSIAVNGQRLAEQEALIKHDAGEIESAARERESSLAALRDGEERLAKAREKSLAAEEALKIKDAETKRHEETLEQAKRSVQQLLAESLDLDDRLTKMQNELHQLENNDRIVLSRRERCSAEQANLGMLVETQHSKTAEAEKAMRELAREVGEKEGKLRSCEEECRALDERASGLQADVNKGENEKSSLSAQLDLLEAESVSKSALPDNVLVDLAGHGVDPQDLLGRFSEQVKVDPEYKVPFEAVLRDYLNAFIVRDFKKALSLFSRFEKGGNSSLSLLVAEIPSTSLPQVVSLPQSSVPLIEKVRCADFLRPLMARILLNVYVVESLDGIGGELGPGVTCVSRLGAIVRGDGTLRIGSESRDILEKQRQSGELKARLEHSNAALSSARAALQELQAARKKQLELLDAERDGLSELRQSLARQQGQYSVIKAEADRLRDNLETVSWELKELEKQGDSAERKSELIAGMDEARSRRVAVKHAIEELNGTLRTLEQTQRQLLAEVMAAKVGAVQYGEETEHLRQMNASLNERISRWETLVADRNQRIAGFEKTIELLKSESAEANKRMPLLGEERGRNERKASEIRAERDSLLAECKTAEENLRRLRVDFEKQRNEQGELNGRIIELRMRHEHLLERITGEYHLAPENIEHAVEPVWSDGLKPSSEQLDAQIAELRAKIEAMGPVNTGAIEEMQQLQERHEFLSGQQDDLVKSRQQLLDAIKKINQTTTEMFAKTFTQINENFQVMFSKLFGGGTAKLILSDEGDILECGIEIYARPPGKRLQSISLLSGGESTMTAVALLFAIFMVKPSPFCVLDELDAPLDDANNRRFIGMLNEFLKDSQFVVITHNRQTISAAGALYGVTMQKDKISTIVSMRFNSAGKAEPTPTETAAAQPQAQPPASVAQQEQPQTADVPVPQS